MIHMLLHLYIVDDSVTISPCSLWQACSLVCSCAKWLHWDVQDHLAGKQYLGWKAIRDKLAELQESRKHLPPPPIQPVARPANGREPEADDR